MKQGPLWYPQGACLLTNIAWLLLSATLVASPDAAAAPDTVRGTVPLTVTGDTQDESLTPALAYVEDVLHRHAADADPATFRHLPWRPADAALTRGGVSRSRWLLRIDLRNPDDVAYERLLVVLHPTLDDVRMTLRCDTGNPQVGVSGDAWPLAARAVPDRNPAFPVTIPARSACTAWFVVDSSDAFLFPARIVDPRSYSRFAKHDYLVRGLTLGMQLLAVAMGVAIALQRRDTLGAYYAAAVAGQMFLLLVLSDLGYILFWGDLPGLQKTLTPAAVALCWALTAQLCLRLLPADAVQNALRWLLQGTVLVACGTALIHALVPDPGRMALLVGTCAVGMVLLLAMTGGAVLVGVAHAGLVTAGIAAITLGGLVEASGFLALLPLGDRYLVPAQTGFLVAAVLFGITLWQRLADKQQRRGAEREVDRRVAERTRALSSTVAELTSANRRLDRLSTSDMLTGTFNRRFLDASLARFAQDPVNAPLSFILFDIDFFKRVNDEYGHTAGDRCLQVVADCVQQQLRQGKDILCRYGGEEFAVILPNTDIEGAQRVAEKIRMAVCSVPVYCASGDELHVTISLGVTSLHDAGSAEKLIDSADRALYSAKRSGRNRWRVATA